jgi:hypothetical protein
MQVAHVEILVEEPSMEVTLRHLLPRILDESITFSIYPSQGKHDLLGGLTKRLKGYASWLPKDRRIVVLVDRDNDECHELKARLEQAAREAGFQTKTSSAERWTVINRLAIEELEAWFFGDMDAVRAAYPKVPQTIENKATYRDPDAIKGGTWEALERILKRAGYFKGGLRKTELARSIAPHLDPTRNRSRSFRVFQTAMLSLQDQGRK